MFVYVKNDLFSSTIARRNFSFEDFPRKFFFNYLAYYENCR